ncbi:MAG TPA: hypothetical protein VFK50_08045 [Sphingomicrobium sp.]|nr:hypothetical protein [Sphingomicrobium sp.]
MDSYSEHPRDFDLPASPAEPAASADVSSAIGTDERRMHVRAYNYWVSLLGGRDYPSIEDLEPDDVEDFATHSVLLDFTAGGDNPALPYVGAAIREECGLDEGCKTIDDIPSRSLLSRLTDHYMQIIANRAPVGFEAEFDNQRGEAISYRGILMPFSSDGDTIDFIYGVINWKAGAGVAIPVVPAVTATVEPGEDALELDQIVPFADQPPLSSDFSWEGQRFAADPEEEETASGIILDADAGLADRLWAARETAEAVKSADVRSRAALYRALSMAYDFAIAAREHPEDYAELLEESGMKAQARAPMTPIVKLVFGIDYDKTRLTEFAAALSYAFRLNIGPGGLEAFIDAQVGGLKALVAAERQARRPDSKPDTRAEDARNRLRQVAPVPFDAIQSDEEFSLVLTRRTADGHYEAVAVVDDPAMVERAIRKAAR